MKAARAMQGDDGRPKEWRQFNDQIGIADGHVQRLKGSVRRHQSTLDDLSGEIVLTTTEQGRQIAALGEAVGAFVAVRPQLVGAAYDDERQWLEPALNLLIPSVEPTLSAPVEFERLEYKAPTHRPSP